MGPKPTKSLVPLLIKNTQDKHNIDTFLTFLLYIIRNYKQ